MFGGFAKCLGIALLSFPLAASAAFFFRAMATYPFLAEEISYRDDTGNASSFETVLADRDGWISQREKPFRGSGESTRLWARIELPPANEPRRVFLLAGPLESAEYFLVRDGKLVDRQKAGAVSTIPANRLVQELDEIFRGFDDMIAANGLEKIKTIGDAYMAAAGVPVPAEDHALRCVRAGLALTQYIEARNKTAAMKWGLRVGVHSGAVVAGIVGRNKYAYHVWGDTVNIASRLESAGEVNRGNIFAYTFELVRKFFDCEYRGKLAAKGKGEIDMYFVLGDRASA